MIPHVNHFLPPDILPSSLEKIIDTRTDCIQGTNVRYYRVVWKSQWVAEASLRRFCGDFLSEFWMSKTMDTVIRNREFPSTKEVGGNTDPVQTFHPTLLKPTFSTENSAFTKLSRGKPIVKRKHIRDEKENSVIPADVDKLETRPLQFTGDTDFMRENKASQIVLKCKENTYRPNYVQVFLLCQKSKGIQTFKCSSCKKPFFQCSNAIKNCQQTVSENDSSLQKFVLSANQYQTLPPTKTAKKRTCSSPRIKEKFSGKVKAKEDANKVRRMSGPETEKQECEIEAKAEDELCTVLLKGNEVKTEIEEENNIIETVEEEDIYWEDWTSSEEEEEHNDASDDDFNPSDESVGDDDLEMASPSLPEIKLKVFRERKPREKKPKLPKPIYRKPIGPMAKCKDCGQEHMKETCPRCKKIKTCEACGYKYFRKCNNCAYKCEFCGKACMKSHRLREHIDTIHKRIEKYKCKKCGQKFRISANLYKHYESHKEVADLICKDCGKAFKHRANLTRHKRIHSGKKQKCEVCGREFVQKDTLKTHLLLHSTGPKRFKCSVCNKDFHHKVSLKEHIERHHKEDAEDITDLIIDSRTAVQKKEKSGSKITNNDHELRDGLKDDSV